MLFIYRALINLILLVSPLIIILRLFKKKEHPVRFLEKFGFNSKTRNKGKLIWFHGSSVGEILSAIPLIEKLETKKNINQILLTSSTLSSSRVFNKLKLKKTIHQFFPVDSNLIVKKFLSYWKPSAAIFIESEIWPNMINNIKKRNIPLILLNSRITKKSFNKWNKIILFSKSIFSKFDICLSQNDETNIFLKKLGAKNIKKIGNLKFSETNIKKNNKLNKNVQKFLNAKKILFAAISTHDNEEFFCANVLFQLKKKYSNAVLLIIPRHVERVNEITNTINNLRLNLHVHSSMKKINNNTDVYLVDTFGETELFLKYCKIVFMGGSLIKHGGQNPLEAARLGCKIIHGPNIDNFKEVYALLNKSRVSSKINNIKEARSEIGKILNTNFSSKKNIKKLNSIGKKILFNNKKEISKYI